MDHETYKKVLPFFEAKETQIKTEINVLRELKEFDKAAEKYEILDHVMEVRKSMLDKM